MAAVSAVPHGLSTPSWGGRRRLVVVGGAGLAEAVRQAGVAGAVTRVDPDVLDRVPCDGWDEVVVDQQGLDAVRRRWSLPPWPVVAVASPDAESVREALHRPFGRWAPAKRALDVLVAAVALVAVLPVLAVAAVAVALDSRGGPLFTQTRVGAGGRPFRFHKLRTMHVGGDDRAHREYCAALVAGTASPQDGLFKLTEDPRVTRVGRLLRRSSLDELPQLWDVLVGRMSLVGPRPLLPSDAALFSASQWRRLRVRPGITGAWQVAGRARLSFQEMVDLDVAYWRDWTPRTDLRLLAATPRAVLVPGRTA